MVVNIYKRADLGRNAPLSDEEISRVSGLGYNPATTAKPLLTEQGASVRSKNSKHDYALGDTEAKLRSRM